MGCLSFRIYLKKRRLCTNEGFPRFINALKTLKIALYLDLNIGERYRSRVIQNLKRKAQKMGTNWFHYKRGPKLHE